MRVMAIDAMVLPNQYDFGNCLTLFCPLFFSLVLNTELLLQAAVFQCATFIANLAKGVGGKNCLLLLLWCLELLCFWYCRVS